MSSPAHVCFVVATHDTEHMRRAEFCKCNWAWDILFSSLPHTLTCVLSQTTLVPQAVYCCAIVASSQDLAFVYAIAWTALNLLVNPYMALFNLYSLGWGFSWLRFFSPYNYAWQVRDAAVACSKRASLCCAK